jgi:hypothetical protein
MGYRRHHPPSGHIKTEHRLSDGRRNFSAVSVSQLSVAIGASASELISHQSAWTDVTQGL